ncbi:MAG: cation:proton antiporter [Saprospiraceae bacterium]
MDLFSIITILTVLSALFGYINVRYLKLPDTIGMMIIAIIFTLGIIATSVFNPALLEFAKNLIAQIDFKTVLLDVMLSFLLFAGAMHTNFDQLKVQRYPILMFATMGVLTSTFLIGGLSCYLLNAMGIEVAFIHCLLFGALISPTDPIAVLGILKKANVPKKLETKIVGESLFNDGIGVVIFLVIFKVAEVGVENFSAGEAFQLFGEEVGGGILLGLAVGYLTFYMLKSINSYEVEVMITLAAVMGGYLLASTLHFSGPLSMVVAGLIVGHDTVRDSAMSDVTELYLDKFWELVDVFCNAILFVLIGLEIIVLTYNQDYILAGIICIPLVLICRYISLAPPVKFFRKKLDFVPKTTLIMTWGGLRGGISIAMALSLTEVMQRDLFLMITYVVVVFSIIVQGLTVGKLVKRLAAKEA